MYSPGVGQSSTIHSRYLVMNPSPSCTLHALQSLQGPYALPFTLQLASSQEEKWMHVVRKNSRLLFLCFFIHFFFWGGGGGGKGILSKSFKAFFRVRLWINKSQHIRGARLGRTPNRSRPQSFLGYVPQDSALSCRAFRFGILCLVLTFHTLLWTILYLKVSKGGSGKESAKTMSNMTNVYIVGQNLKLILTLMA